MVRCFKVAVVVSALAVSGCARTSPARFFTLEPAAAPAAQPAAKAFVLAVGPMVVASHLDRPQIATRTGPHELHFDHYHRWAEPLKDSIPTVLSDNLRAALPEASLVQYPGSETLAFDWRVVIQVIRFDATLGGDATLRAGWMILTQGGDSQEGGGMFEKSLPVASSDYAQLVDAESRLLALLSEDIAAGVRTLQAASAP
ncbi:MAG TPA: PqiC family protein [Kiritimatiellia bacterium]